MKANAAVLSVGSYVTLPLGTAPPSGPVWHEVQVSVNGGAWSTAATSESDATGVLLTTAGTYQFQTRLHHALSGANTGWSPTLTVTAE